MKEFIAELKRKWVLIIIVVCITSGIGFWYSFKSRPKYIAISTVMLESSKGGGSMSGALALASQFGMIGSSSSAVITEDKLIEIIKAETIIKTTLFKKVIIDSSSDLLANHFINLFGYRKAWEKIDTLKDFRFINQEENMSLKESRIFKVFYKQIINNFLTIDKSKSGIITITTTTPSELFSKCFNDNLVDAATHFYVDRITAKGRKSLDIVEKRVDSITIALRDAEYTLAKWKDASNRLVKAQGMMEEMRLRRNVEIQNTLYLEGVKRLEVSKFTFLDETPFLQIIGQPTLPLEPIGKISSIKGIVVGFIIGCFLSGILVFVRKKYDDLMTEAEKKQFDNQAI